MTAQTSLRSVEMLVSEGQTVEHVRPMLGRSAVGSASVPVAGEAAPQETAAAPAEKETVPTSDEALQVLALAQRTAENHITSANRHAQAVRSEAQSSAERIRAEAIAYAEKVRSEADEILAGSRAEAERIVTLGRQLAEQLDLQARQRYEDAVGSLDIQRQGLQKQIEALTTFDSDYRHRLSSFVHAQLRALWIERAEIGEIPGTEISEIEIVEAEILEN